ncbi:hypothetical protein INR49_023678 [Caranx melampygus]|nr:hypothetical protein INR49_023678 [Caranx melampygus]
MKEREREREWREHLGPMPVALYIPTAPLLDSPQLVPISGGRKGGQDGGKERRGQSPMLTVVVWPSKVRVMHLAAPL